MLGGLTSATGRRAIVDSGDLEPISDCRSRFSERLEILKAATATHQVLQRASNVCAVRSGWVYAGRMVEMRPTNAKLRVRAERIVAELGGVDPDRASVVLRDCDDDIKVALVAARLSCSPADAARHLDRVHRSLVDVPGFER